ncbi:MAG: hypothetical protein VB934_15855, partial [Polyangiaceae bacterium]
NEFGCTAANDYCGSYWVAIAREHQTEPIFGCSLARGAAPDLTSGTSRLAPWFLLGIFGLILLRRRRARPGVVATLGLLSLLSLLGCRDEAPKLDTEFDCKNSSFTPCGGEVRGAWSVTDQCAEEIDASALIPGCEGITLTPDGGMIGTIFLGKDGRTTFNVTQRSRMRWKIPSSCLQTANSCISSVEIRSCEDLVAVFTPGCDGNSKITDGIFSDGLVCTKQDDICACSATEVTPSTSDQGEYTTNENQLHMVGERKLDFEYCVEDRIMTLYGKRAASHPFGPINRYLRLLKRR